jgi:hypothetical protein
MFIGPQLYPSAVSPQSPRSGEGNGTPQRPAPAAAQRPARPLSVRGQFELPVPAPLIDELADIFPNASGRDIKGLTKLVAKFCHQKAIPPTLDVFKRCSIFRGMDQLGTAQAA